MSALLRKELRSLRVYLAFALAFLAVTVVSDLLGRSGPEPLRQSFRDFSSTLPEFFGLLALFLGTGLAAKEVDEGTLAFLDGLPLGRTQVFFTKLSAAMLVLALLPVGELAWVVANHAFARGSLDAPFHPALLLGAFVSQLALCASLLCLGALLGFARSLTWLLVGLLAIGQQRLAHAFPRASALDPLKLVEAGALGVRWQYDGEAFAAQGCVAAACVGLAWALFTRAGRGRTLRVNRRPVVGALVALLTVAALVAAIELRPRRSKGKTSEEPDLTSLPPSPPASTRTAHYAFSYPGFQSTQALALADGSDAVFERVHALLGVDAGAPIVVDLSGSTRNTGGTAFSERIRMPLSAQALATLAHETTHVAVRRAVGEEGSQRLSSASVLNEGLASWVEGHFVELPVEQALVLAALLDRHQLELNDVFDERRFFAERDEGLKYPIGRGLVAAAVARYGEGAVGRLLRAFADPKLPPSLSGATLWQTTFQLAGMDLPRVADDFFAGLAATLAMERSTLDALPRPRARLVKQRGRYGVEVSGGAGGGRAWVVRFKPLPTSLNADYDKVTVSEGEVAWRKGGQIAQQRVCFQVGLSLRKAAVLYEPWSCVALSAAAPLD